MVALREINGRGQKTEMRYDGFGRLVLIDHLVSADVAFAYRVDGPRLSMTDGTGTTTYAYDDAGRRTSVRQGLTGIVLSDLYWPGTNRRRSLAGGAQTWTYAYDAGLRPESVGQTLGAATPARYAYHPSGAVSRADYGNGTSTYLYYDARGRATNLYHTTGLASNQIVGYRYGADGLMDAMSDTIYGPDGQPSDPSWFTTYAHDRAGRLVSESRANYYGPNHNSASEYAYDAAGNRTGVTRDGVAYPYAPAGADDRFASGEGFAMGAYDADGNPGTLASSAGTMGFAYDERGRVDLDLRPGGLELPLRRRRAAGGAGRGRASTTRFVYDGDGAVVEADGSNRPTLYRLPGVGFVRNGAQRYEQGNALGSVLAVRDASGAVVGRTEYDAYGRETYAVGGERGGQRFAGAKGYPNDDATGMQLLGARYYLPKLGRFLTPDPIGHAGGPNLYAYCEDSPLENVDPSGLQAIDSTNATAQQAIARAATDPAGSIKYLTESAVEHSSAAGRAIFRGALRTIFKSRLATSARGIGHSLTHAREYYGLARNAVLTQSQVATWTAMVKQATENGRMFPSYVGGDQTTGFIARVNGGTNLFVHYFTEGPRAGQFASAWRVSDKVARTLFDKAAEFKAGGG